MIVITEGYLRVITPIIVDNKMIIMATLIPVIEIITPKFHDIEYAILN